MNNICEKICLTLILFKVFDIYFCHYFTTNIMEYNAMEPQTMYHFIAKDKVAERHI